MSSIPPWLPMDKRWRLALPHSEIRPYTELEASFSLSLDMDGKRAVTLRGLAKLWRWSTGKVSRFLVRSGLLLTDSGVTRMETLAEHWRDTGETAIIIDSEWLREETKRKRDGDETSTERQRDILKNPIRKTQTKNKNKSNFVLPDWIDSETWAAFIEVRNKKGAPSTDRALSLIISKLDSLKQNGQQPLDVLNNSIMRGYTGVFEIYGSSQ